MTLSERQGMTTTDTPATLTALPVAVHGQKVARISDANLTQFETLLDTADDAILASIAAHTPRSVPDSPDEATAVLLAVLKTIAATTDTEPPARLDNKRELIRWTAEAIVSRRDQAVHTAVKHRLAQGLNPEILGQSLQLMTTLNAMLGARA